MQWQVAQEALPKSSNHHSMISIRLPKLIIISEQTLRKLSTFYTLKSNLLSHFIIII